jgi:toxin ParE1/3/4
MAFAVEFARRAERDVNSLYDYIHAEHSTAARRWLVSLEKAIFTLGKFPQRCARARESRKSTKPLRQLLCGSKPNVYRILFEIDEARRIVWILTVRHAARDLLNERRARGVKS